jgi:hypothetical protein
MIRPATAIEIGSLSHDAESHSAEIERAAQQRVADDCPYHYYFRNVEYQFYKGVLTLHGRVHSCYLKQVLQAVLEGFRRLSGSIIMSRWSVPSD